MISMILPVFNGASYIERCIKSVISAKKEHDIELIIIDDGSKDNTAHLIQQFLEENPWIIMHQQQNNGVSSARNKGLDIATGNYIGFIDSDDTIDDWYFDFVVEKAVLPELDMLLFGYKRIYLNDNIIVRKHVPVQYSREDLAKLQLKVTENRDIYFFCWTKIYNRRIIGDLRFDPDVKTGEDIIFNISYMNKIRHASVLADCPYNYYEMPNSLSSGAQYDPYLLESVEALYNARVKAHNWPVDPIEKEVLLSDFAKSYVEHMLLYLLLNLRYMSLPKQRAELVRIRQSFVYEICIPNYSKKHPSRGTRLLITSFSNRWYAVTLGLLQIWWLKKQRDEF